MALEHNQSPKPAIIAAASRGYQVLDSIHYVGGEDPPERTLCQAWALDFTPPRIFQDDGTPTPAVANSGNLLSLGAFLKACVN